MMKSFSEEEQIAHGQEFYFCNEVAQCTQNPIERAFGIIEFRLLTISHGLTLHHENVCLIATLNCEILHNMRLINEKDENNFEVKNLLEGASDVAIRSSPAVKKRNTLLYYLINSVCIQYM